MGMGTAVSYGCLLVVSTPDFLPALTFLCHHDPVVHPLLTYPLEMLL